VISYGRRPRNEKYTIHAPNPLEFSVTLKFGHVTFDEFNTLLSDEGFLDAVKQFVAMQEKEKYFLRYEDADLVEDEEPTEDEREDKVVAQEFEEKVSHQTNSLPGEDAPVTPLMNGGEEKVEEKVEVNVEATPEPTPEPTPEVKPIEKVPVVEKTEVKEEFVTSLEPDILEYIKAHPEIYDWGKFADKPTFLNLKNEQFVLADGLVSKGSLDKLVEYATSPSVGEDVHFVDEFLLMYNSFTTGTVLLNKIVQRYNTPPPPAMSHLQWTEKNHEQWRKETLNMIRIRIIAFVKKWIERQISDFDSDLMPKLDDFIEIIKKTEKSSQLLMLLKAKDRALQPQILNNTVDPKKVPKSILPKGKGNALTDWDPAEVARQLTLIQFDTFRKIPIGEFFNQNWSKTDTEKYAPNITNYLNSSNKFVNYLVALILQEENLKARAEKFKWIVAVGEEAKKNLSFNLLSECCSALSNPAVARLRKTWDQAGSSLEKKFTELQKTILPEGNYKALRALMNSSVPCIPFIGVFFADMISVDECNSTYVDGIVNFGKCKKMNKNISEITSYQIKHFEFKDLTEFKPVILEVKLAKDLTEQEMMDASFTIEPSKDPNAKAGLFGKGKKEEPKVQQVVEEPKKEEPKPEEPKPEPKKIEFVKKEVKPKTLAPIDNVQELYPEAMEKLTYKEEPEENVIWEEENGTKAIKEVTLDKLLELLTSPTYYDTHMQHTFMLTFRSFTDQDTLFTKLMERFNIPPPEGLSPEELAQWKVDKLDKIRLRVSSTIKYWIENFYLFDFNANEKMIDHVNNAVAMMDKCKGGKIFSGVIQRAMNKAKDDSESTNVSNQRIEFPPIEKPLIKKKTLFGGKEKEARHKVLTWPSIEIARQLTLIEYAAFIQIEPKECLNQSWAKGQRETKAPGICAMVARFNLVSMWVGTIIVSTPDLKERAEVVEKFIEVASKLWELNNFNAVFTVCSGLSLASVYRLKKTWPEVKEESRKEFETLNKSIARDGNFAAIRNRIKNVKPPAMPYIGIYLTDLTFIEDGNPKYVGGKINFVKCKCFAGVIRDLQTYQNTAYQYAKAPELFDMLTGMTPFADDEMYKASLEIEPKEKKGEKK
jgi:hypothetical protein